MPAMVFVRRCLFAALNFAALSWQTTKDPLRDFCRRWGHQTAEIDGKLYIDGGQVTWNPQSVNPLNHTNTWLIYSDLNSTTGETGMPQQYANLTKNDTVPSVSGGILWADQVNKALYLYGGEYQTDPEDFAFWTYDTILNQWNKTQYESNVNSIQRVAFGAGTVIDELGLGFYYGGWLSNHSVPGWEGPPLATNHLVQYDMTKGTLDNHTGPDDVGRAEGAMVYLPSSDGGLLVYFGGVEDPYNNGSFVGAGMSTIHIFDVASSKWYTQSSSGDIPPARRRFCAGATWADDQSSYNIHLYGGLGIENITGFDDAYILSIPSFTWIKAWPAVGENGTSPHGMTSCNVINKDQMIIIGGWFPASDNCDSPNGWGQHNMVLGYNGDKRALWDKYDPNLTKYWVPTPVLSVIGGGPTGSATVTQPATWDNPDLSVYFTRIPTFAARTATRTIPTITGSPRNDTSSHNSNVGAIAGGTVGGVIGLIVILGLILFLLHRKKKKAKAQNSVPRKDKLQPVELPATPPIQEMPSPHNATAKDMMQQQEPPLSIHPALAGSTHSRSPSSNVPPSSPYQHHELYNDGSATPSGSPRQNDTTYHIETPKSPSSPSFSSSRPQESFTPPNRPATQPRQSPEPYIHTSDLYRLQQKRHSRNQLSDLQPPPPRPSVPDSPRSPISPYHPSDSSQAWPLGNSLYPNPFSYSPSHSPTLPASHTTHTSSHASPHFQHSQPGQLSPRPDSQGSDTTEFQTLSKCATPPHFYGERRRGSREWD